MLKHVYSLMLYVMIPWALLRLWWRGRLEPTYRLHIPQRFGRYKTAPLSNRPIVIHAVSLGETRAAQPLIQSLLVSGYQIVLTHSTATGREQGERFFASEILSGQLVQYWLPYDLMPAMRAFIRHVQPRAVLLIETEVWPHLTDICYSQNIPLVLTSARLSERSLNRLLRLGDFAVQVYRKLSLILAQTALDAERFQRLIDGPVSIVGNLKFDVVLDDQIMARAQQFKHALMERSSLVIASTREGEEEAFLRALEKKKQDGMSLPLVILVPRHPQRFSHVESLLKESSLRYIKRTSWDWTQAVPLTTEVILGDSLGEMPLYYSMSDIAIIAGSFQPLGGQNLIEATAFSLPLIVGPHTFNFEQATSDAIEAGACQRADTPEDAIGQCLTILSNSHLQSNMRAASQLFAKRYVGATLKIRAALADLIN